MIESIQWIRRRFGICSINGDMYSLVGMAPLFPNRPGRMIFLGAMIETFQKNGYSIFPLGGIETVCTFLSTQKPKEAGQLVVIQQMPYEAGGDRVCLHYIDDKKTLPVLSHVDTTREFFFVNGHSFVVLEKRSKISDIKPASLLNA